MGIFFVGFLCGCLYLVSALCSYGLNKNSICNEIIGGNPSYKNKYYTWTDEIIAILTGVIPVIGLPLSCTDILVIKDGKKQYIPPDWKFCFKAPEKLLKPK